jgi:hypothetical protein
LAGVDPSVCRSSAVTGLEVVDLVTHYRVGALGRREVLAPL